MFKTETPNYCFGFNGMLRDDDIKEKYSTTTQTDGTGNSYSTEFRMYDPRVGRWLSLDPLMNKFPWQSPYLFAGNDPILNIDYQGKLKKAFNTTKYPTLALVVDQALKYASQNKSIIPNLLKYGHFNLQKEFKDNIAAAKQEIRRDLTPLPGKSDAIGVPKIVIRDLGASRIAYHVTQDEIQVSSTYADLLENKDYTTEERIAMATQLLISIYHEYIHNEEEKTFYFTGHFKGWGESNTEGFEKAESREGYEKMGIPYKKEEELNKDFLLIGNWTTTQKEN